MALVFIFFVENLQVYPQKDREGVLAGAAERLSYDPATLHRLTPESIAGPRRYSLIAVTTAALAVAFLPKEAVFGPQPVAMPVFGARTVEGFLIRSPKESQASFVPSPGQKGVSSGERRVSVMMIDGNRNGRLVVFGHKRHVDECGGERSCARCHHLNMPFDENTSCYECHRDMYGPTDIFDHASHVAQLGGNHGCKECHAGLAKPKTRQTAKACIECHQDMPAVATAPGKERKPMKGIAGSYMGTMHHQCIGCHRTKVKEDPKKFPPAFARCAACHSASGDTDLHHAGPYAHWADGGKGVPRVTQAVFSDETRRSSTDKTSEPIRP
jgi:hypothetical protein